MITIEHNTEGTTADGTVRGDEAGKILKRVGGFMWSRNRGLWVHNRTWHYSTRGQKVAAVERALTEAGIEFVVERGELYARVTTAEDVADVEVAERDRAAARIERLEGRAERKGEESDAGFARAREMASHIPFGQPILVGHHSERGDRRYRARINSIEDKAMALHREAEEAGRRAATTASMEASRVTMPAARRKLVRLETERRLVQRRTDGDVQWVEKEGGGHELRPRPATGDYLQQLTVRAAELDALIAYWTQHVASLEESGVKVWSKADFKPGDWAKISGDRWMEVEKANPKTLSLQTGHFPWPLKYPYTDVTDRRSKEDVAAAQEKRETTA